MRKKLKLVQPCSYTPAHKPSDELMWSMLHNDNKASHRPAHTLRMFSLQSALLGQPVLLQPDTESLLIGAVLAGD
ncbi:TPA: hypothetical protein ACH3X3_003869 [Trebouxia sp. C0006]